MKVAEWKRSVRAVLPDEMAGWAFRGSLCYRRPWEWALLGVTAQSSRWDSGAFIWQVQMPLFMPFDGVVLSWSERVGGGRKYGIEDRDSLVVTLRSAFANVMMPDAALAHFASQGAYGPDVLSNELAGYANILLGRVGRARRCLARADQDSEQVRVMNGLLDDGGGPAATAQLGVWRDQTAASLGLQT
jgi:hypothetical protein